MNRIQPESAQASIQAVIFNRDQWSCDNARKWLHKKNLFPIKRVHITENYYRYRIQDPEIFKYFLTKKLHNGIEFILGFR